MQIKMTWKFFFLQVRMATIKKIQPQQQKPTKQNKTKKSDKNTEKNRETLTPLEGMWAGAASVESGAEDVQKNNAIPVLGMHPKGSIPWY